MTTDKRFVLIERKGVDYILDSPNYELDFIEMLGDSLSSKEIVDLLNEQEEQIQDLQKRNKNQYQQLKHIWNCIANKDYKTLHDEYTEMEKLEKQLQKEWKMHK